MGGLSQVITEIVLAAFGQKHLRQKNERLYFPIFLSPILLSNYILLLPFLSYILSGAIGKILITAKRIQTGASLNCKNLLAQEPLSCVQ